MIGIINSYPASILNEIKAPDFDFRKEFPDMDIDSDVICRLTDEMCPKEFLDFIYENHIKALFVSRAFKFVCRKENFDANEFKKLVEHVCHIFWQQ